MPKINAIHTKDCLKGLSGLTPGSIDLAFADPPFNIGYDYDVYDDKRDSNDYMAWSEKWIQGVFDALKPDGTFWLAIGDEYAAELKVLSQQIGFRCRSWVIWYYTFGVNCQRKFSRSHAHLFHFVKDPENFTFNDAEIRVPSARQLVYGDRRANPRGRLPDDTWILRPQDCETGFQQDEDTWYFPRVAGTFKERAGFHGCQMPEQLLGRIVRSCSNPGDVVMDPFAGSATTLAVAKKLDRQWVGFEISGDYVKQGRKRLGSITPGDELEGAPEPRVSAPATPDKPNGRRARQVRPAAKKVAAKSKPASTAPAASLAECVAQAFAATHDGFSVDRVVADPELDSQFVQHCHDLGHTLAPAELNRQLFRMRKAGQLSHLNSRRRTPLTWEQFDQFMDATEIAIAQLMVEFDTTLDQILCDPELATGLDRIAGELAPGFTPLDYRWGALKLRKEAKTARQKAESIETVQMPEAGLIGELAPKEFGSIPGVYLLADARADVVYAGATLNLQKRAERLKQLAEASPASAPDCGNWSVSALEVCDEEAGRVAVSTLLATQCQLVTEYAPKWNFSAFSLV